MPKATIPDSELRFTASRSSGPGGQNVNKVESRITLHFDLERSAALSDDQKARLRERLRTRISREGILQVSSQKYRDQGANREAAVARFAELVDGALEEPKPRRKKTVSRAQKQRRLEEKKRRSEVKKGRGRVS